MNGIINKATTPPLHDSQQRGHPRTMGWLGTAALAMGGSNQMLFIVGALLAGQMFDPTAGPLGQLPSGTTISILQMFLTAFGNPISSPSVCNGWFGTKEAGPTDSRSIKEIRTWGKCIFGL